MSIKVDDAAPFDGDPEALQSGTLVFPMTHPGGGATIADTDYAYRMPPPTAVRLADGRVLHCFSVGDTATALHARSVYLAYAPDETTYCTTNNSVDWDTRMLLFDVGNGDQAGVMASISRVDENRLAIVATSDRWAPDLRTGDGSLYPPTLGRMAYDGTSMYASGQEPSAQDAYVKRLWKITDLATAEVVALQREYEAFDSDYGFVLPAICPIEYDSDGADFYSVQAHYLLSHDLTTGKPTSVGATGVAVDEQGMAYDSAANVMYGNTATDLYTVNMGTGAWTLVGTTGVGDCLDMAYDVTNDVLYGLRGGASDSLYTVNRATGAWTVVGSTGVTNPCGLGYDSDNNVLYGSDNVIATDTPRLHTVNRATGAFTVVATVPHPNPVEPWPATGSSTVVYYSDDDGLTWQACGPISLDPAVSRIITGDPDTLVDYVNSLSGPVYDASERPRTGMVLGPSSTSNIWHRADGDCSGNNGVVYRSEDGGYYVTANYLTRDNTFPTTYNISFPCLLRLSFGPSTADLLDIKWPQFNVIDVADWPDDYGEGETPDWDWLAPPIADASLEDHATGNTHSTRSQFPSANLFEFGDHLWFTTSEKGSTRDSDHRLWSYNKMTEVATWVANTPDYPATWYRCSDNYLDGALVWIRAGASTGGIWTGNHRNYAPGDPADQVQITAGTGVNIRIAGAVHQGCEYIWCTWPNSSTEARIGLRAVARQPCSAVAPFEFPHPWFDILKKWDEGDHKGALLLMDRNNDAIEEVTFDRAVCSVAEYPHPWGEMVLKALKGDKLWRDVLEEQEKYMVAYLSSTCRYAPTPWTFTTKWHDILPLWGQSPGKDALIISIIDGMWEHFQGWQQHAADYSGLPLCDGSDAGLWTL